MNLRQFRLNANQLSLAYVLKKSLQVGVFIFTSFFFLSRCYFTQRYILHILLRHFHHLYAVIMYTPRVLFIAINIRDYDRKITKDKEFLKSALHSTLNKCMTFRWWQVSSPFCAANASSSVPNESGINHMKELWNEAHASWFFNFTLFISYAYQIVWQIPIQKELYKQAQVKQN